MILLGHSWDNIHPHHRPHCCISGFVPAEEKLMKNALPWAAAGAAAVAEPVVRGVAPHGDRWAVCRKCDSIVKASICGAPAPAAP
jgi:hypothetical protein